VKKKQGPGIKVVAEFTDRPVSKQRKYQLRRERDRKCIICGKRAVLMNRCLKHVVAMRDAATPKIRRNGSPLYGELSTGGAGSGEEKEPEVNGLNCSLHRI
jgi:hypothetical protein